MTSPSSYANVRNIILIFVIVNAILLFSLSLFPFIDLPNHLAESTIYKFHDEPGNAISQYYQPTPWYFPNTFHTVFCSLFPTVELGNKVFHVLCIVLLHATLFLIIKRLNGNPWYALLGILFTYNYNLSFGFVGYAISIPAILLIFYLTLLDFEKDNIVLKVCISLMLVIVFLMHAQNALFALLLYGLMLIYRYRKEFGKLITRGVLVPLPLIALIFTWWFGRSPQKEESTGGFLFSYYANGEYLRSFLIRARLPFFDNFQLQEGMSGLIIASTFFACVFIPILFFRPWRFVPWRNWISGENVYVLILLVSTFLCYFILPDKLPGQTPLSQRFCSLLMLAIIIAGSIWLNTVDSWKLRFFACAAVAGYSILWSEYLYSFNTENRNFDSQFFSGINNSSKLTGLIYDNKYRGRKVYIHYPNYFLVWKQGIVTSKIIDYRFGVVVRLASENEIPFYEELIGEYYKPLRKYANMDYILVRGKAPVSNDTNLSNFSVVQQSGDWRLYVNKNLKKVSGYTLIE